MKRVYERDEQGRRYCRPSFWQEEPMEIIVTMPIDMTDADQFRKKMSKENKIHISISSLIFKAVANALEEYPVISGMWLSKDKIWVHNLGETYITYIIQVEDSTVPGNFIDNASKKSLLEISGEIDTRLKEIRSKEIDNSIDFREEFPPRRPFFYIANIGAIGPVESITVGRFFSPSVLVTAVLGVGAIMEEPAVWKGEIQIRKMMKANLIFDHRAMMPNTGLEFLSQIKTNLEEPDTYLI